MNKEVVKQIGKDINKRNIQSYKQGYSQAKADILKDVEEIIDNDRNNGNIEGEKGFSPALCLSKINKYIKKQKLKELGEKK